MLHSLYEKISARSARLGDDASLVARLQVALKRHAGALGGVLALALALLLPFSAFAAVTFDSSTDVSGASGASVNITVSASDTFLMVTGICNGTGLTAVSATVAGHALTGTTLNSNPNPQFTLYLAGVGSFAGTDAVVITMTGCTGGHLSRATLYKGSVTTLSSPNIVQGNGVAADLTTGSITTALNSWVVGGFRGSGAAPSGGTITARAPTTNTIFTGDSNADLSAGAHTFTVTNGASGTWEYTLIELPVAASVAVSPAQDIISFDE